MNNDCNIKKIIDTRLSGLTINPELKYKLLNNCKKSNKTIMRPLKIAIAICLCMIITVPVLAAKVPAFNRLIGLINAETAQFFQPIELIAEDEGIRMEVVAAMSDDDTAIVYLTLTDITGGNRIDNTVDIYDYTVSGAKMFTHELINYNKDTNTATIRMLANGGNKLNGKKISVKLDSFLSNKVYFNDINLGVKLNNLAIKTSEIVELKRDCISGLGGFLIKELENKEKVNILKPNLANMSLQGIDFVQISNIGFVDGRLHIQTKWNESIDDHGFLYLLDENGDKVNASQISFGVGEDNSLQYGSLYREYVFNLDHEHISNYSLYGEFVKNNNYVKGNWQTTFKIKSVDDTKKVASNVDLGSILVNRIAITPVGISISGNLKPEDINLCITMNDNSQISFDARVSEVANNEVNIKYVPHRPIDVNSIKEVCINSQIIEVE